jgi:hypothetical protein
MISTRTTWYGFAAGLVLASILAFLDHLIDRGYMFGLQTAIVGVPLGGFLLLLALGMAVSSYYLASANKAPALRRRLLASATFTGPAGMSCGLACVALWAAAGQPWFP